MTRTSETAGANPDTERWNRKYADQSSHIHDTEPRAEPELLAHDRLLNRRGIALDVAAGRGKNALYLASAGYTVVACDLAVNGLSTCAAAARKRALPVHCLVCDLDAYRFPYEYFDLVSVTRYLDRAIFPELIDWLKPEGLLFYKTFNRNFLKTRPGFNPDYMVESGELNLAFRAMDILASDLDRNAGASASPQTSFILARKK